MIVWVWLSQLLEVEAAKQSLESVNDTLRLQLDQVREAELEAEELRVRGELEETQAALATAEDDLKTYQQELTDTQVHHRLQPGAVLVCPNVCIAEWVSVFRSIWIPKICFAC